MTPPGTLNLTIYQRATFRLPLSLNADMTGSTLLAQLWDEKRRTKYADFTIEWTDQSEGEFELVLPFTTTRELTKNAKWDLLQVTPSGEREYWLEGDVVIDPNYTDVT